MIGLKCWCSGGRLKVWPLLPLIQAVAPDMARGFFGFGGVSGSEIYFGTSKDWIYFEMYGGNKF